jgi:archaellum biogenesis ATPase FlaH
MITAGNILYAMINFNYLPKADLLEDKVLREFTLKLKETDRNSIIDAQVFNGISPIGISLESLKNEIAVSYLKHKINDNYKRQLNALTTGDFAEDSIVKAFPEITDSDLLDLPRAISAKDLPIEEVKFKPFYSEWDRVFSGLINTDYVLIYGLTGTGKSSIQSRIIADAIKRKIKVASYQTEMSLSQSRIYIYGSFLDLIPHEATAYFEDKRDELLYLNSKLGEYLILPSQNSFNWTTFEKLFESDAEIIFLDQISSALGQMGKIENEANVAEFSKKVQALVMKYKKPVFVNHQETFRTATAAELEKKPDQQFVGLQTPRYASSVLMDLTLALLIRKNETNQRTIQITKDRFRGIASLDSFYCDINNKTGKIEGDVVKSKRVMDKLSQVNVKLTLKELGF